MGLTNEMKILEKIHRTKTTMIANGKKIWDTRFSETPMSINEACTKGMKKHDKLIPNMRYYGYSETLTEAVWNDRLEVFIAEFQGVKIKKKYFDDFIPMLSEGEIETIKPISYDDAVKEYQKILREFDKVDDELRHIQSRREKLLMDLHQSRNRYEKLLRDKEIN